MRHTGEDGTETLSANSAADSTAALHPLAEPDNGDLIRQAELIISNVLRGGVLVSAGVIVLGVILFYARATRSAHGLIDQPYPSSLAAVGTGLVHGDPLAIVALGLLLLLATPVIRVAVSVVAFALEHDRQYVLITLLVLFILLVSFFLGKGGA
jgi:uncharacterized membrane protein